MTTYTDKALETMQEKMEKLIVKLANTKPNEDLTRDDIRDLMFYITAFQSECGMEHYRRKDKARKEKRSSDKPNFFNDLRKHINRDFKRYDAVLHYERGYITMRETLKALSEPVSTDQ